LRIPLEAVASMFCENTGAVSSNDVHLCHTMRVKAKWIQLGCSEEELLPPLEPKTLVIDRRLATEIPPRSGVRYLISQKGQWITNVADLKKTTAYASALAAVRQERSSNLARRSVGAGVLIGPAVVTLWLLWRQALRRQGAAPGKTGTNNKQDAK